VAWPQPPIASGLAAFAKLADETCGEFCVGDAPTIADICLVPQLYAARRYQVELGQGFDRLLAIEARCLALPAFANAMPERQPDAAAEGGTATTMATMTTIDDRGQPPGGSGAEGRRGLIDRPVKP